MTSIPESERSGCTWRSSWESASGSLGLPWIWGPRRGGGGCRRQRRAKSDGLDARKLLGMLVRYHAGESKVWSVVRVPTVEEEDRRQLHRELRTLKKERTRVTNRIK